MFDIEALIAIVRQLSQENQSIKAIALLTDAIHQNNQQLQSPFPNLNIEVLHLQYVQLQNELSTVYLSSNQFKAAYEAAQRALQKAQECLPEHHPQIAYSYSNMGCFYNEVRQYQKAIDYTLKALAIWERTNDLRKIAIAYNNLGNYYGNEGDIAKSMNYHIHSLQIKEELLLSSTHITPDKELSLLIADSHQNLGNNYLKRQEYKTALHHYQQATSIRKNHLAHQHPKFGHSFLCQAVVFNKMNDSERAMSYYQQAIDHCFDDTNHCIAPTLYVSTLENRTTFWLQKKAFQEAAKDCEIALSFVQKTWGANHPFIGRNYFFLAQNYRLRGDLKQSLNYCQKAIIALVDDFNITDPCQNPSQLPYWDQLLIQVLVLKGKTWLSLAQQNLDQKQPALLHAYTTYQLIVNCITQLRRSHRTKEAYILMGAYFRNIYSKAIQIVYLLYNTSQDKKWLSLAFHFAESSQSFQLLASLRALNARQHAGLQAAEIEEEQRLRLELTLIEKQIKQLQFEGIQRQPQLYESLKKAHFQFQETYERFIQHLEKQNLQYFSLKYQQEYISLMSLSEQLPVNSTVIQYFCSQQQIFIFVVNAQIQVLKQVIVPSNLEAKITAFNQSILFSSRRQYIELAQELTQILIHPIRSYLDNTKHLYLIPDNHLYYIPFEALFDALVVPSLASTYPELPYLLHQYTISYHYSATLLIELMQRKRPMNTFLNSLTIFAPIYRKGLDVGNTYYPPLHETALTTENIPNLLSSINQNSIATYKEFEATKSHFTNTLKQGSKHVLLLAHGYCNQIESALSGLIFHPKSDAADHLLREAEIWNLEVNCDLLFLCCCKSGLGKLEKSEGLIGINRSFLFSGAAHIICTLFNVYESSSCLLNQHFWAFVDNGLDYATALQKSKINMSQHKDFAPVDWAGFVLW